VSLDAERIYGTLADILEKDEDLEFASIMVQNLNIILITSSELSDLRKRLKNLETRVRFSFTYYLLGSGVFRQGTNVALGGRYRMANSCSRFYIGHGAIAL
jgi:hypothetical protein